MNWIKAIATTRNGRHELTLTDLDIMADGATEEAMLLDLEHTLFAHYAIAKRNKRTPFVDLLREPDPIRQEWVPIEGGTVRKLNLPEEVSAALAAVLRAPEFVETTLQFGNPGKPKAA